VISGRGTGPVVSVFLPLPRFSDKTGCRADRNNRHVLSRRRHDRKSPKPQKGRFEPVMASIRSEHIAIDQEEHSETRKIKLHLRNRATERILNRAGRIGMFSYAISCPCKLGSSEFRTWPARFPEPKHKFFVFFCASLWPSVSVESASCRSQKRPLPRRVTALK